MQGETENTVHGRLLEAFHISGYTFERACSELEWLLKENRWKSVGPGFEDINAFIGTIDLSMFKIAREHRKSIAKRIEQLNGSQRASAKMLGVNEATINRDLKPPVANATPQTSAPTENVEVTESPVANATPAPFSGDGVDVARDADRRAQREENRELRKSEREKRIANAGEEVPEIGKRYAIYHDDCRGGLNITPETIDIIVTDPPYSREYLHVYSDLAEIGRHALREGGIALVMTGQTHLRDVIASLDSKLSYHWTLAYLTPGGQAVQQFPCRVNSFWKPVLVYRKGDYDGDWFGDVSRSDINDNDKDHHRWGQSVSGMRDLMKRFVKPGDIVLDPFLGGGTTAVVALELGCHFIGYDTDDEALKTTRARIGEMDAAVVG